jgi:Ca-activated chloride channel family protein
MSARITAAFVFAVLQSNTPQQPPPTFRAETRLVVLQATVLNGRGEAVTTLDRDAFTVYENGGRQQISVFRRDDVPVSLGLLIDNSGSMRRLRSKVEAAALAFVRASNPQDEVFMINFADKATIDVTFTSDLRALETGIAAANAIGGTALRDAVALGESYVHQQARRERKVLLVITDGIDNASLVSLAAIQRAAERNDAVIDAVGLFAEGDASRASRGRHELTDLTDRTGGVAYFPATDDEIETVALELAKQIRNQYTIAYAPTNQTLDGSYRRIRVEARGRERYTVRTRPGYRATLQ